MADKRINALTTTSASVGDDYFAIDGATNGTRALSAFSPTFGGNATVTGTLTAASNFSIASTGFYAGGGTPGAGRFLYSATAGSMLCGQGGSTYDLSLASSTGTTILGVPTGTNNVLIPATAASTSASSGALVVGNGTQGGLGVGGDANIGGSLTVTGASNGIICNGAGLSLNTAGSASVRFQDAGVSKWWIYKLDSDNNLYFRDMANGRMQLQMLPGATSDNAISTFNSKVDVGSTISSTVNTNSGVLQLNLVNSSTGNAASSLFRFNAGTRTATLQAYNDTHATLAGQLRVGTSNGDIVLIPSGVAVANFSSANVTLSGDLLFFANSTYDIGTTANRVRQIFVRDIYSTFYTPASATDTGTAGRICYDSNYIYICTATNTWKRAAISTW